MPCHIYFLNNTDISYFNILQVYVCEIDSEDSKTLASEIRELLERINNTITLHVALPDVSSGKNLILITG